MSALTDDEVRNGYLTHRQLSASYRTTKRTAEPKSYDHDRVASVVHYYLSLLGDPDAQIESFAELFDEQFVLDFASGRITTLDGFADWLRSYTAATEAAMLSIEAMEVVSNTDDTFTATVDFEWDGVMADGSRMEMATRHVWTVVDDPVEMFPRIKAITVEKTREMAPR